MSTRRRLPAGCTHAVPILRATLSLLMLLVVPASGFGQLEDLLPRKSKAGGPGKAKFTATVTPESAAPGDEVTLSISAQLPQGYYIYSTTGDFGGRTKIDLKAVGLDALDEDLVPDRPAKTVFEPLFKAEVGKFFDEVTWTRKYRVQADAKEASVSGTLSGQYCSGPEAVEQQCIPIQPPFEIEAKVLLTGTSAESTVADPIFARHIQPMQKRKGVEQPIPVAWDFSLSPTDAKPGEKVTLAIKATLEDGWHTFSLTHQGEGGSPTVIDVSGLAGLKPEGDGFVADRPFEIDQQADLKLEVHHHEVTWRREYTVLPDVKPGAYGVSGQVAYQYCKNVCIQGKTKFELGVATEQAPLETKTELAQATPDAAPPPIDAPPEPKPQPKALAPFLLVCFLGGFLALLAPCSYPMVPITISFFLKQSESQHQRTWILALVYCGSIIAAFTFLGVVISAVFGVAAVNQLATNAWLNLAIGIVFVIFALDMLGLYEFHVPGWMLTWSASKEGTGSYVGAIFMALTFTLTSFTCTFPVAGGFLVAAAKGDYYWPTIGMAAFGTGFALPFLAISAIPGALKRMPKSGGWMTTIKVVLGLVELGAAAKFLSMGDPEQFLFDHVMVMVIWLVLALCASMYLLGIFRLPHDGAVAPISAARMLWAAAFLVLSGQLLVGLFAPAAGGGWIMNQIIALAPPRVDAAMPVVQTAAQNNTAMSSGPSIAHHGVSYELDIDQAVALAKEQNSLLFLDFTGWWCANCREMEKKMADTEWRSRVEPMVRVQLYLDRLPPTVPAAVAAPLLAKNQAWRERFFDQSAMPMYAVVTPDGLTALETYVGSETPDKSGSFTQFLDASREKWEQLQKGTQAIGKVSDRQEAQASR